VVAAALDSAQALPQMPQQDPAASLWQQQVQQLSQVHRQFVSQQAQVQQRF